MNRRDFLKDAASLTMTLAMAAGAEELFVQSAHADEDAKPAGPPVNCAVIGFTRQPPTANLATPAANSQFPPR